MKFKKCKNLVFEMREKNVFLRSSLPENKFSKLTGIQKTFSLDTRSFYNGKLFRKKRR